MPSKERRLLAQKRKAERAVLDQALQNASKHILDRLGKPSRLNDALSLKGTPYAGVHVVDDQGNLCKREDPPELGANVYRQEARNEYVAELKKLYADSWGKRGEARRIALEKGLSSRTVQKYFKYFP